tara:strand:- start:48 stop:2249 length:2202 start_codon:yes stop_codon:yes gene_type:complete
LNNLWDKIKHSNVVKVATAYGVLCWILLQVQDSVLPTIGAPLWVAQIILFLILIGFPIACLIAWATEVGSSSQISKSDGISSQGDKVNKKTLLIGTILSISIIGLFAFYISPYVFDYKPKRFSNEVNVININNSVAKSSRFDLNIGKSSINEWGLNTEIAISPNGRLVAFTKNKDGSSEIYIRDLWVDEVPILITDYKWGTDVHGIIDFTDDSEWVTYFDSGILKRVRVTGGATQTVLKTRLGRTSGYDLTENKLIFTGPGDLLWEMNLETNEEIMVFEFDKLPIRVYRWPQLLPDGDNILVSSSSLITANTDSNLLLYNSKTGVNETIVSNGFNGRFIPQTEHIVFVRESSLWAVPFDIDSLQVIGNETEIIRGIQTNGILGSAAFSISDSGRLIYLKGSDVAVASADLQLDILSRDGQPQEIIPIPGRFGQITLSPDKTKLLYTAYDGSSADIWVWDFEQGNAGRRTFNSSSDRARWSPNGENIIFNNSAEDRNMSSIRSVPSDGTGTDVEIFNNQRLFGTYLIQSVSTADNRLFFNMTAGSAAAGNTIWAMDLEDSDNSERTIEQLDVSPNTDEVWWARISSSYDGKWITYVSNESGSNQVYIRPYPDIDSGKWQVSARDATSPIWSPVANELFFRSGNNFFKVGYDVLESDDSSFFNLSEPEFLFEHTIVENHLTFPAWDYDSTNDRFMIISASDSETSNYTDDVYENQTTLTVVESWFNELNRLAPAN